MLNNIRRVALAAALMIPAHRLTSQPTKTPTPATPCRHCERPTPFEKTQGVAVTIMVREGFADRTVDALIRDEPGGAGRPLVAIKRAALSPALVYRALAALSQSREKYNGPPSKRATTRLSAGSAFQAVPEEDRAWVANLVTQLSGAPATDIAGVGRLPAITLTLDKHALRGK